MHDGASSYTISCKFSDWGFVVASTFFVAALVGQAEVRNMLLEPPMLRGMTCDMLQLHLSLPDPFLEGLPTFAILSSR